MKACEVEGCRGIYEALGLCRHHYYLSRKEQREESRLKSEERRKKRVDSRRNAFLSRQGMVCAICGASDPGTKLGWHLDHDHSCCSTGRPCGRCDRGVLCYTCNQFVVAVVEKYPNRIIPAMNYLGLTVQDLTEAYEDDKSRKSV